METYSYACYRIALETAPPQQENTSSKYICYLKVLPHTYTPYPGMQVKHICVIVFLSSTSSKEYCFVVINCDESVTIKGRRFTSSGGLG